MFHFSLTKWMSAAIIVAALVLTMTENSDAQEMITTSSGLQYVEHETGSGDAAKAGDTVDVHYTGPYSGHRRYRLLWRRRRNQFHAQHTAIRWRS